MSMGDNDDKAGNKMFSFTWITVLHASAASILDFMLTKVGSYQTNFSVNPKLAKYIVLC